MHWFWRATIAVITSFLAMWVVNLALLRFLSMAVFAGWPLQLTLRVIEFVAPLACYGLLTYFFGPVRPDGETRCRKCSYILRGISEPRCPECGERI